MNIKQYQINCWTEYKKKLDISNNYKYIHGNPIKVHVPVDIGTNSVMIVGAYPTAHFNTIKTSDGKIIRDVPIGDHLYPFSDEKYFDGERVRTVKSGEELENLFLSPLRLKRENCWITDLVKVFLFKEGHAKKYRELGLKDFKANRNKFMDYAKESMSFLVQEIELVNPKVILTLGEEVTSVVLDIPKSLATSKMNGKETIKEFSGNKYKIFAAPHPGILMRETERSKYWKNELSEKILPQIKIILNK